MTYMMVRKAGIEPARGCPQRILSPLRLPVPPYPLKRTESFLILAQKNKKVKSFFKKRDNYQKDYTSIDWINSIVLRYYKESKKEKWILIE